MKKNNHFGVNNVMIPKIKVGNNNFIGASTKITKNLKSDLTLIGLPVRIKNSYYCINFIKKPKYQEQE